MCQFRVHRTTIAKIVLRVCQVIYQVIMPTYISVPTKDDSLQICDAKFESWNFSKCFSAADGKHTTKPLNSRSMYYNSKRFFSLLLLVIVNSDYRFLVVDVGLVFFLILAFILHLKTMKSICQNHELFLLPMIT